MALVASSSYGPDPSLVPQEEPHFCSASCCYPDPASDPDAFERAIAAHYTIDLAEAQSMLRHAANRPDQQCSIALQALASPPAHQLVYEHILLYGSGSGCCGSNLAKQALANGNWPLLHVLFIHFPNSLPKSWITQLPQDLIRPLRSAVYARNRTAALAMLRRPL